MLIQSNDSVEINESQVQLILDRLDAQARVCKSDYASKRASVRRRLRAPCLIRYASRDGTAVLTAPGKTRDLSRTGLGVLAKASFSAHAELYLTLILPDEKTVGLTGKVVYARGLRLGWYIVGVKLQPISDDRLSPKGAKDESEDVPESPEPPLDLVAQE